MAKIDDNESSGQLGLMEPPTGNTDTNGASEHDAATTEKEVASDPKSLVGIMIRVPQELRSMIEVDVKLQDTSMPQLVAKMLADAYGYTLPIPARKARKKYATDEEKKQAQRDSQKNSRDTARAVLRAVERGDIQVDLPTLIARLKEEEAAKEAAKAAEGAATPEAEGELATAGATS